MAKQLTYSDAARQKLLAGVEKTVDAVRVTLGPAGRNVVLQRSTDKPLATADGVTVLKDIELSDEFENLAAALLKEVAQKTNDAAGDGTTTSAILAESIYREGLRHVAAGANPMALKRGIDKAVAVVREDLKSQSQPCDTFEQLADVASISANNDRVIGEMVAKAIQKVSAKGAVTTKEGKTFETSVDFVEGMTFDKGYMSPYFITDREKLKAVLEEPFILLYDKKISTVQELVPILEKAMPHGRPILIIAEDIENEVLSLLVLNTLRGTLRLCAVKAPAFGERRKAMLEDMAVLTGGVVVSEEKGMKLEKVGLEVFGTAAKVEVEKENTVIIGGKGEPDKIKARIAQIKAAIAQTDSNYDREKLEERLAKLEGGVAEISVGAATEAEMKAKKALIEDAVSAARAAAEEGVVLGGGVALLRASEKLASLEAEGDEALGIKTVIKALTAPLSQIAYNAGADGSVVVSEVQSLGGDHGFNARTHEYVNLREAGIIDPTKVARTALENAASMAGMLLTAECLVAPFESDETKKPKVGENIIV
ncbi:MAG: chaperonin GroEL [Planctomycetota bacterium]